MNAEMVSSKKKTQERFKAKRKLHDGGKSFMAMWMKLMPHMPWSGELKD